MYKLIDKSYFIPLLLSIIAFYHICGTYCIDPTNISWLVEGDSAQHYLGWAFYRKSPWGFPIGLNPDWGLENSLSIAYADALPIFAILFKFFDTILPEPFQYYGIWFLINYILTAIFAWKIFSLYKINTFIKTCSTLIIIFSPLPVWRMSGHQSLVSHFLILWGLYIYLSTNINIKWRQWIIILVCSLLIHPYFTFMLLCIWISDIYRYIIQTKNYKNTIYYCFYTLLSCFITMWQIGLIGAGANPAGEAGFGLYHFNINGFINSFGKSSFLPALPTTPGSYEGYAYMGLGVILLLCFILIIQVCNFNCKKQKNNLHHNVYPLCWALLILACLAISNKIGIFEHTFQIFKVSHNNPIQTFRASGRFIWPAYYFIIILSIIYISKTFNNKLCSIFICFISVIQIVDLYPIYKDCRNILMKEKSSEWFVLKDEIWNRINGNFSTLRVLYYPGLSYEKWREVSYIAKNLNMNTNASWLPRGKIGVIKNRNAVDDCILSTGNLDKNTVYIFPENHDDKIKNSLEIFGHTFININDLILLIPSQKKIRYN